MKLNWKYCECGCKSHTWNGNDIFNDLMGGFRLNRKQMFNSFEEAEEEVIKQTQEQINKLQSALNGNTYVEVSQFNHTEERKNSTGRVYYSVGHKAPATLEEAIKWSQENSLLVKIISGKTDEEVMLNYPRIGSALYFINEKTNTVDFIKGNWDSSD